MRVVLVAVAACLVAACGRAPEEAAAPEPLYWSCDGLEFRAVPQDDGTVVVTLPGREVSLEPAGDDSGRYVGSEFVLEVGDDRRQAGFTYGFTDHRCERKRWTGTPWDAARERGAVFRALGQEPGWYAEVVPGGALTVALDYGERVLTAPAPDATPLDGGARGYQVDADGHTVQLVIEDRVCFDGMSGHVFPETATVAVDGVRYHGCGVPLAAK